MDKYEFKHLWEEIQILMEQGKYADAAALADKIDWRRVKNSTILEKVGDLYKVNRRYEDARDILLFAYDRKPENKQVCYSLCEICCKTGNLSDANEYYKEYEKLAPRDYHRYILKYKLYCAAETGIDERIEVLENLKDESPQEKWMYELAKLYDKRGLATKCTEVCDELVLWFGEGKYVNMALELKRLHGPLTEKQQEIYDNRFRQNNTVSGDFQQEIQQEASSGVYGENGYDPYSDQMNSAYDNYAVQEETAYGRTEENAGDYAQGYLSENENSDQNELTNEPQTLENGESAGNTRMFDVNAVRQQMKLQEMQRKAQDQQSEPADNSTDDDMDIQIKTVDVGRFNTMNLQAEIAKGMQEMLNAEGDSLKEHFPMEQEDGKAQEAGKEQAADDPVERDSHEGDSHESDPRQSEPQESVEDMINKQVMNEMRSDRLYSDNVSPLVKQAMNAQPPEEMAKVLTQESDGQIRFVMPEDKRLEKQITGQMSIEDIRAEWEQIKQKNKEKHEEELRQQVQRHTGQMFTEFEAKIRDSILAKMESGDTVFSEGLQADQDHSFEMESLGDMNDQGMLFDSIETDEEESNREVEHEKFEETSEKTAPGNEAEVGWTKEANEENREETVKAEEPVETEESKETEEFKETKESEESEEAEVTEESEVASESVEAKDSEEAKELEKMEESEELNDSEEKDMLPEEKSDEAKVEAVEEKTEAIDVAREEVKKYVADASQDQMNFSWDEEDGWGEENDFEFGQETDPEEKNPEEKNPEEKKPEEKDSVTDVREDGAQSDEFNESYDRSEEREVPDDGSIEFESLPREEEYEPNEEDFAYDTERMTQDDEVDAENSDEMGSEEMDSEEMDPGEDGDGIHYDGFSSEEAEQEETESEEEASEKLPVRELSKEEEALYGSLLQGQVNREQLARAIDSINMASYVGNVVITGEADMNTLELAKCMVKEIKASDSNFVGSAIKMNGKALNARDVTKQILDLKNGALIIDKPNQMTEETTDTLYKMLQREDLGIVVFLLDSRKGINAFFKKHEDLRPMFNAHVHVKPISEEALARYARKYAYENEFSIDSMGMLALHTRIDEMQTAQHAVTYDDVKEVMDDAMDSAASVSLGHFFDILFGRRYDEEDMIVITEKDFR